MASLNQKNTVKVVVQSRITQAALILASILIFMSAINRYTIAADTADKRAAVEAEILELEARKESLGAEVRYLQNDRGIEAEMRKQFDIAREGEQVVIIVDDLDQATATVDAEVETDEEVPWYRFW